MDMNILYFALVLGGLAICGCLLLLPISAAITAKKNSLGVPIVIIGAIMGLVTIGYGLSIRDSIVRASIVGSGLLCIGASVAGVGVGLLYSQFKT